MNFAITILIFIAAISAFPLSLSDAQKALLKGNLEISASRHTETALEWQLAESKGAFTPSLSLFANYNATSEAQTIEFPFPPGAGQKALGDKDRFESGVDLSMPVFTGLSRFYSTRAAERDLSAQRKAALGVRNRLSFQLGLLYLGWELSCQKIEVQKTLLTQIQEHATATRNRETAGIATLAQSAEADARLSLAQAELFDLQNRADSLKWEILNLTRLTDTAITPEKVEFPIDANPQNSNALKRPEIQALGLSADALKLRRKSVYGRYLPQLSAMAGYRFANPGLNMGADSLMNYGLWGIGFTWTLFDGLKARSQAQNLSARALSIRDEQERMSDRIKTEWERARTGLARALRQKEAAEASVTASTKSAQAVQDAHAAGTATSIEVLDALSRLAQSRFLMEQALFQIKSSWLSLQYASGQPIQF